MAQNAYTSVNTSLVLVVLVTGLTLSILAWHAAGKEVQRQEHRILDKYINDTTGELKRRLDVYTEILDGTQGLFAASQNVSAAEWQTYIEELHLSIRHPGIKTMSFVRRVSHEQKTGYEQTVHRIFPPGDRNNYFVTEYIMPLAGSETERGRDLGHESVRRAALEQARDTDKPIATGRITLAQDPTQQAAIRLFLPIYRPGVAHNTVQQRRNALMGFVSMAFYVGRLIDSLHLSPPPAGIDLEVLDAPATPQGIKLQTADSDAFSTTTLLYDKDGSESTALAAVNPRHRLTSTLEFAGRHWILTVKSLPGYRISEADMPWVVLGVGIVITLLLSGMTWLLTSSRARGWAFAQKITAELRNSEQHTRAILDNATDGIMTLDGQGMIVSFNPAAERLFGYTATQITGKNISILMPESYRNRQNNFTDILADLKKISASGLHGQRKDGTAFPLEFYTSEAMLNNRRIFIGTVHDITRRMQAEHAINRFKMALDGTLDMIFMFEADTLRFVYLNRGAINSMGYSRQELLEMTPYHIKPLMPETAFRSFVAPLIAKEMPSLSFETLHRHKNGRDFPVEVFLQFVTIDDNAQKGLFVAIVRDITERKKIERIKNELISTVSHELRTPLASIRGALGLIAGGVTGEIPAQAKKLVDIAHKNSERLIRLTNDILDIEKIEAGKMAFDFHPLNIMSLIEEALKVNQSYAEQYQVKLAQQDTLNYDMKILGDHDKLIQALTNLLSNAVKFSPPDNTVTIAVTRQQRLIRVSVSDNGSGIPPEFHERIFQKFAQADASDTRQKGGTGLGLSITKAIIEKHGGHLGFTSVVGSATTFYFNLPEWQETNDSASYTMKREV